MSIANFPTSNLSRSAATQAAKPAWAPTLLALGALLLALPAEEARAQNAVMAAPAIGCPDGWRAVPPGVNPVLRCLPNHIAPAPPPGPARMPPPGCPRGWQQVPQELNPILRCQPIRLAARLPRQPAPEQPVGCPKGWKAVPAGVNPLLRCLPDNIAATPPPGWAGRRARTGCPTGWKPVSPQVNSLMRCLPDSVAVPPLEGGPDPGGPGQGRDVQALALPNLPDLALVGEMVVGSASIPWGNPGSVSSDDAVSKAGGRCRFRYAYPTLNQGSVAAGAAVNRIRLDKQDGAQLAQNALPALAADAQHVASGHIQLSPGTWMLYVHADAALAVPEGDEKNNLRRVRVTVEGDCD